MLQQKSFFCYAFLLLLNWSWSWSYTFGLGLGLGLAALVLVLVLVLQFRSWSWSWRYSLCLGLNILVLFPSLFRNGLSYGPQMWRVHWNGPSEQKPIKNFGEKGVWAYLGTAEGFWVPPIISGTGKATNFKFCTHFYTIDRNKSPLTISGKVAVGVARNYRKFSGHPYNSAHRAIIFAIARLSC